MQLSAIGLGCMGMSYAYGTPDDVESIATLEKAGQLKTMGKSTKLKVSQGKAVVTIQLPRQGVSLLKMDW